MSKIWRWLGMQGKVVIRLLVAFNLVMAILAFLPGGIGQWGFNYWVAIDQTVNALTLGDPDETISSRMGKWSTAEDPGLFRSATSGTVCFFLDLVDANHCANSIEHDEGSNAVVK